MNRPHLLMTLVMLLILSASARGQQVAEPGLGLAEGAKPLNLALPPQPPAAATFGSSPPGVLNPVSDLGRLTDLGRDSAPGRGYSNCLPYGSGYEARQQAARVSSRPGFATSSGSGNSPGGGFGGRQVTGGGHGGGGRR